MTAFDAPNYARNNNVGFSNNDLLSNAPLNDPYSELRSLAPNSEQNEEAAQSLLPKFEDVLDKFDYNKDSQLSKEEVQQAASDQSFKPQEQKMAQLLSNDYDTIKPMGRLVIAETEGLSRMDLEALDGLAKDGITTRLAFNYGNSIASDYFWKGAAISASSWLGTTFVPTGWGKLAVGVGGSLTGLGYGIYGIGKGVSDYYSAKPDLERIRGDIRNMAVS